MVAELDRHWQPFHQIEQRVSNLKRINLEIEEIKRNKETATTKHDLRETSHREKINRLITKKGQYKYNIATCKKCILSKNFTDKLMVVRDLTENPTPDNYASCPDCLDFFMRKTIRRRKLDCPAVTKSSHKDGKQTKTSKLPSLRWWWNQSES